MEVEEALGEKKDTLAACSNSTLTIKVQEIIDTKAENVEKMRIILEEIRKDNSLLDKLVRSVKK